MDSTDAILRELIRRELASIPADKWGFFFPAHVALWRFINRLRPGPFDEVQATYGAEPSFIGRGAIWFTDTLIQDDGVIGPIEAIMYHTVDKLRPELVTRESFRFDEIPSPNEDLVRQLAKRTLELVDQAITDGTLEGVGP
jgi:hypothetical protein